MNTIFWDLIANGSMMVYMDDMAIHTARREGETEEEHIAQHWQIVNQVLAKLDNHDLYLNPEKCDFEQPYINFLGVRVANSTVQMEQGKVEKV